MPNAPTPINLDIAIIGGGVAGLWTANRLKTAGYSVALFEHRALGSDQTMASQGMIHGGMKYTLSGAFTGASESIADMPRYWRDCLCGEGDVDLRMTRLLSDHFFLWSTNSITAKLSSFLASKMTRGRVDPVPDEQCPPLLRNADFNGSLYKLVDIVLDVRSLITNLAQNIHGHCFLIDWSQAQLKKHKNQLSLLIQQGDETYEICAQRFIFCAGKGNSDLLKQLKIPSPKMQLRPLQQVMVKHRHPFNFYGHCLGGETTPRLTISSHALNSHEKVWYLGGSLAEKGATMDAESLIELAKTELADLLPWVDLTDAEWQTLPIQRAEPLQPNFARPEHAFAETVKGIANLIVTWPTKLTLAPNLANQVLEMLSTSQLKPNSEPTHLEKLRQILPIPSIAPTPWDIAFPPELSAEERLAIMFPEADDPQSDELPPNDLTPSHDLEPNKEEHS